MINNKLLDKLIPVLLIVVITISFILVPLVKNSKPGSNNTGTSMEYENKIFHTRKIVDFNLFKPGFQNQIVTIRYAVLELMAVFSLHKVPPFY